MIQKPISITALASISPLGKNLDETWKSYQNNLHCITEKVFGDNNALVSEIPKNAKDRIETLRQSDPKYKSLDPTVLYALFSSREAVKMADWKPSDNFGINIGSSRGATQLF